MCSPPLPEEGVQASVGVVVPKDGPTKAVGLACCLMLEDLQPAALAMGVWTTAAAAVCSCIRYPDSGEWQTARLGGVSLLDTDYPVDFILLVCM